MSLAIVTDSTSYLNQAFVEEHGITVLPLMVNFSDGSYREMVDIQPKEFFKKMEDLDEIPASSQPSFGDTLSALEHAAESHDEVLVVTLSGEISGTYNTSVMAAQEIDNANVRVFDSKASCRHEAYFIEEALRLSQANWDLDDIIEELERLRQYSKVYLSTTNLKNFAKGGRISNGSAFFGDMLRIRPILEFVDGKILAQEKVRTDKRVIQHFIDQFDQALKGDQPLKAIILEAVVGGSNQAQKLKEAIQESYPDIKIEHDIVGPVIATHTGPTVYSLGWAVDTDKIESH